MPTYIEFRFELEGIDPKPWRLFHVHHSLSLWGLHCSIHQLCGWRVNGEFSLESTGKDLQTRVTCRHGDCPNEYVCQLFAPGKEPVISNAIDVGLGDIFTSEPAVYRYAYDVKDSWAYSLFLTRRFINHDTFRRRLVDGEGLFPNELQGDVRSYRRFVATAESSEETAKHEHKQWLAFLDSKFVDLDSMQSEFNE